MIDKSTLLQAPEYYTLTNRNTRQWFFVNPTKNSKGELLDEVSKVDDSLIVLEQERQSVSRLGDNIHVVAGSLLGIFAVHRRVLAVFQEYRLQPHTMISKCILLNKKGKPIAGNEDCCVMHFDYDARCDCGNKEKAPITNGQVLSPYEYYYCHKRLVPPLDLFEDVIGWMFSARLVERIRQAKFTNFEFDRVILE